jgi:hypothetical protein
MWRRWTPILCVLLLPLVGIGVYWVVQPPIRPGVTLENFRLLHKEMTRAQVESILGKGQIDSDIMRWKSGKAEVAIAFYDWDAAAVGTFFEDGKEVTHLNEQTAGAAESFRLWLYQRTGW